MNRCRALLASSALAAAVLLGACGDDGAAARCASGSGATACVADDGQVTVEGFLPGSTVTLTITSGTTTTRAAGTGATATGTGATGTGAGTTQSITAGPDGKGSGTLTVARGSLLVRGVSTTNRSVNLTLTLG